MTRNWWSTWWPAVIAITVIATARAWIASEADPFWGSRAGADTLRGAGYTRPDTWSWAPAADHWTQNEWGWNIALALARAAGGNVGLFAFTLAAAAALLAALTAYSHHLGAAAAPATAATVLFAVTGGWPFLTPRANLADLAGYLALLAATPALSRAATRTWRSLAAAGGAFYLFTAAGTLTHLAWPSVTGLGWAAIVAYTWTRTGSLRHTGAAAAVFGAAGLLGTLSTPLGVGVFTHSSATAAISKDHIAEWQHAWDSPGWLTVAAAAAAAAVWLWRQADLRWLAPPLLLSAGASLWAIRFVGLASLAVAVAVAVAATRIAGGDYWRTRRRLYNGFILAMTATAAAIAAGAAGAANLGPGQAYAANAIRQLPANCQLFASPALSGFALGLRSDITVWIDGRNDYWGSRYGDYLDVLSSPNPADGVTASGATCALTATSDIGGETMNDALGRSPDWRALTSAGDATVWVRTPPPPG